MKVKANTVSEARIYVNLVFLNSDFDGPYTLH